VAPTLVEFLAPVRNGGQSNVAVATLYYLIEYSGRDTATATDVKTAMVRARIPKAGSWNVRRALAHAKENVDRAGSNWSLTDTGKGYVKKLLALPDDSPQAQHDVRALEELTEDIADDAARGYIDEAIKCLRVGAFRAAIVFLWTGAAATIRDQIWSTKKVEEIEAALQTHNPRARFRKKEDFAYVKDKDLLQIALDLSIYDKTQKTVLGHALDLRNSCGHPTKYNPGEKKASSFIEDVVGIVFKP
jgi:hypothetical protein